MRYLLLFLLLLPLVEGTSYSYTIDTTKIEIAGETAYLYDIDDVPTLTLINWSTLPAQGEILVDGDIATHMGYFVSHEIMAHDGIPDVQIQLYDTNHDGIADLDVRRCLICDDYPRRGYTRTSIAWGQGINNSILQLGSGEDWQNPTGKPLISLVNGRITAVREAVHARQAGNAFILSQYPLGGPLPFENPFVLYDLDGDGDAEVIIRVVDHENRYGDNEGMEARYSWDADNDGDLDYSFNLYGEKFGYEVLDLGPLLVTSIDPLRLRDYLFNRTWEIIEFVDVSYTSYESNEGIYEKYFYVEEGKEVYAGWRTQDIRIERYAGESKIPPLYLGEDGRIHMAVNVEGIERVNNSVLYYEDTAGDGFIDRWEQNDEIMHRTAAQLKPYEIPVYVPTSVPEYSADWRFEGKKESRIHWLVLLLTLLVIGVREWK